jgi:hypothetical protein
MPKTSLGSHGVMQRVELDLHKSNTFASGTTVGRTVGGGALNSHLHVATPYVLGRGCWDHGREREEGGGTQFPCARLPSPPRMCWGGGCWPFSAARASPRVCRGGRSLKGAFVRGVASIEPDGAAAQCYALCMSMEAASCRCMCSANPHPPSCIPDPPPPLSPPRPTPRAPPIPHTLRHPRFPQVTTTKGKSGPVGGGSAGAGEDAHGGSAAPAPPPSRTAPPTATAAPARASSPPAPKAAPAREAPVPQAAPGVSCAPTDCLWG